MGDWAYTQLLYKTGNLQKATVNFNSTAPKLLCAWPEKEIDAWLLIKHCSEVPDHHSADIQ